MMSDRTNSPADGGALVTVALAVLNGGEVLEHAVRSVMNQSWPHWELLLLDDGSTDEAINRLTLLADPRIVVIRDGQNLGLASRLNQAVDMAKGEYFARMDHDDICHPERFARQVAFLDRHPEVDLLATQCLTMDEQERLIGRLPSAMNHSDICRRPWQGFYMAHPSWMGRTEWFRRNVYQDPAPYCCEDQELLLRAHYSSCYHTLPEHLLAYRIRTHTPWKKRFRTRISMGKMKVRHFLNREELINSLLSGLVELARLGHDGWKEFHHRLLSPTNVSQSSIPTPEERQEWETLISEIKVSSER
jgi:glycosyltransferase involved in cell wall biosynthesis